MIVDKYQTMHLTARHGQQIAVRIEINPRAKRLILRLDERNREAVAVIPSQRHYRDAEKFAAERIDWIADRMDQLPPHQPLADGQVFNLRGRACQLSLEGVGRRASLLDGDPQRLCLPGEAETLIRRAGRYLRKAAKEDLGRAVETSCATLGVEARRITVKDTRSRWGSCTSDGRLAFSWRLIMAPSEVLEYVAAHECAHLLEMNHSPRFWAHVAQCKPDWKAQRAWLRRNGARLQAVQV